MTDQITVPKQTWDALREALEESNSLLAALMYEKRSNDEIEKQVFDNRVALTAAVQPQAQGDVSTGYVKVRVATKPSNDGFCFCSPEDPETGGFQDGAQFFGRVYAHPQATEPAP